MDNVTKPAHYQRGGIETIEVIRAKLGPQGFGYYCEGNVLKYLTRWRDKNGLEDLRKAGVYLDWLIAEATLQAAPKPETDGFKHGPPIDPPEHHATEAPLPPFVEVMLAEAESDEPGNLKAGEAFREHGDGA